MEILESRLDSNDEQFQQNAAHNRALVEELRARLALVHQGGDEQARQVHTERDKLFVRDRIDRLLDSGSPFLELSPLAS